MPLNIDRSPHRRGLIIIIAVYLVANALILALVNPDVKLTQAADGGS